jgi:hypothetical protein
MAAAARDRDETRDAGRSQAPSSKKSLEDEIRLRAYYRYLERETESGDELSDWLEAESDVLGRRATGVDAAERVSGEEAAALG